MKLLLALLAVLLTIGGVVGGLNYAGVCIPEHRILPEQEKFSIAASNANARSGVYITTSKLVSGQTHYTTTLYKAVPYKDGAEFLRQNPNCCQITVGMSRGPEYPPPPSVLSRFLGFYAADVLLNYTVHYIGSDKKEQSGPYKAIVTLNNCGSVVHE